MIRAVLFWIALATMVSAQEYPALYDVTGVATDDVLNIRSGPTSADPIIGTLASTAQDVEVIEEQGGWGRVNTGESSGWASLDFLERQPHAGPLVPRRCFGTEPFWTVTLGPATASTFDQLGFDPTIYDSRAIIASTRPGAYGMALDGEGSLHGIYSRDICSDGMSDQLYGVRIDLIVAPPEQTRRVHSGCCSLTD